MTTTTYTCPNCHTSDNIEIAVTTWRRIIQDDPDNIMTDEAVDGGEDWDDDSPAACRNCYTVGWVLDFCVDTEVGA